MSSKKNRLQLQRPEKFEIGYLKRITQQFSPKLIIGRGGFGTVYKGKKDNGEFIAVKMLNQTEIAQMDDTLFRKEVLNVMHISHPNIVRLEGYCINKDEELITHEGTLLFAEKQNRLICFEYLPSGSLQAYLSNEDKCHVPNWNERYNIIKGICKGLYYLHEGRGGEHILHLDLKPANVLLDKNMIPKIADFGQSRLRLLNEETHTRKLVGTCGYMPIEYIKQGTISKKTDIYSLGVIVMEIIAGERKYPADQLDEVRRKWEETPGLRSEEHEEISECIELALDCMAEEPKKRPYMKQVIMILGISEDDMNHHPDGIEEHCVLNIDYSEEERHGLLRRCTMTADRETSLPEILGSSTTAVSVRTQLQEMMNSGFLCGVPMPIIGVLGFYLLMYLVLAYIVLPRYEMWRAVSITVNEASFTRFALVNSSCSPMLTYNFSVVMAIYNPRHYDTSSKTMDVTFFFGGQRFHVVRPGIWSLSTNLVSMLGPLSGTVMLDAAGVAEYKKATSMGLFEVEMVVVGQVTYYDGSIICNVQATCPFKLRLAPPDWTTQLELLQRVKCLLHKSCSS